jgi:putative transposase
MYGVHPTQIGVGKKRALETLARGFSSQRSSAVRAQEDLTASLYQQIGQLKVELDWLKKKLPAGIDALRKLKGPENEHISIMRQCELRAGALDVVLPAKAGGSRGSCV